MYFMKQVFCPAAVLLACLLPVLAAGTTPWLGDLSAVLSAPEPGAGFGSSVTVAGDLDGDGRHDLAVGASATDRVYVYFGREHGYPPEPDLILASPCSGCSFGSAVASVGDVTGDGFDDLLIGAPGPGGGLYLFCGRPGGPAPAPCWHRNGAPGEELGAAVSRAGDQDGDGLPDFVAGAPGMDEGRGRVALFLGSPGGPSPDPAWSIEGELPGGRFGEAVAGGVDVTGDGVPDITVGVPGWPGDGTEMGRAVLFAGGPVPRRIWSVEGEEGLGHLGRAVALPGDMDGDGIGELAVGSPGVRCGDEVASGRVVVFAGAEGGPGAEPLWTVAGSCEQNGRLGSALSAAGDLDGDGLADLVVGGPGVHGGAGTVLVMGGRRGENPLTVEIAPGEPTLGLGAVVAGAGDPADSGFPGIAVAETGTDGGPRIFLFSGGRRRLGGPDWIRYGEQRRGQYGMTVASAGDVNGDGYEDLLVGACMWDEPGLEDAGRIDLYLGGPGGLARNPAWSYRGTQAGEQLGLDIAGAGDVNGDGYDDILASGWKAGVAHPREGRVLLFLGGPDGPASDPDWSYRGNQEGAELGLSVAGLGDLNGDGYADIGMTSPLYVNPGGGEGRLFVFFGGPSGPGTVPDWTWDPDWNGTWFGTMVGFAGDVNGDGFDDLFVTDMQYGQDAQGLVLVFHGGPTGLPSRPSWRYQGDVAFSCLGYSAATAGDVNGDGFDDLVVSGAGMWDIYPLPEQQVVEVFLGGHEGLADAPVWVRHGYERDGDYGSSVAPAGDINGDGYGDILIGTDWFSLRGIAREGRLDLHLGGPDGITDDPVWSDFGGQEDANLGVWCDLAGDLDGDGAPDLVAGAQYLEQDIEHQGAALVYYGNRGCGWDLRPRQLDPEGSFQIPLGSRVRRTDSFRVELGFPSPLPPGAVRVVAEVRPANGDGEWERQESPWQDSSPGAPGRLTVLLDGLDAGIRYSWRARVEYRDNPFQRHGPWLDLVRTSPGRAKLSTDVDADGDGWTSMGDCDDGNDDVWTLPGEVRNLRLVGKETMEWDPPDDPGGDEGNLRYDTLRAEGPRSFENAECLDADGEDRRTEDPEEPDPDGAFFYLVRAENACPGGGGTLGHASSGRERSGRDCP